MSQAHLTVQPTLRDESAYVFRGFATYYIASTVAWGFLHLRGIRQIGVPVPDSFLRYLVGVLVTFPVIYVLLRLALPPVYIPLSGLSVRTKNYVLLIGCALVLAVVDYTTNALSALDRLTMWVFMP